ncbi:MAG: single-stranded DNA-binding protein [Candidatus Aminicenantia bacterium]
MRDIYSLNKVILLGRLGRDPEIRYSPQTERHLAKFTLATTEVYFDRTTNEKVEKTQWHKIYVWGALAEFARDYLTKGRLILVEGKLRNREWKDPNGNKKVTTEIEAQSIILLGRREEIAEETVPISTAPEEESTLEVIPDEIPPDEEEPPF